MRCNAPEVHAGKTAPEGKVGEGATSAVWQLKRGHMLHDEVQGVIRQVVDLQ